MTTKITNNESEKKMLNEYLADLYEVFRKKLGEFIDADKKEYCEDTRTTEVKLIALLQEIIKIKKFTVQ